MAVLIDSGPVSATQSVRDVPREQWRELVAARRMFCAVKLSYDCRELLRFVDEAPTLMEALGYTDKDDFLRRGLELDPQMVDWALAGLKRLGVRGPVPTLTAVNVARDVEGLPPLLTHADAGQQGGRGKKASSVRTGFARGENPTYLARRLKRDAPETFAALGRGEFRSVRAAAIAGGVLKVKAPIDHLRHYWKKATDDERRVFLAEVSRCC